MRPWTRRTFMQTTMLAGAAAVLPGCMPKATRTGMPHVDASPFDGMATELLTEYPEAATAYGLDSGPLAALRSQLTDRSLGGIAARTASTRERLARVRTLMPTLEGSHRLDGEVVQTAHEIALEGYAFGHGDVGFLDPNYNWRNSPYSVAQNLGAFVDIPDTLTSLHPLKTPDDANAFVERVQSYVQQIRAETVRLQSEYGMGVVAPDFILDKALTTVGGGARQNPADNMMVVALRGAGFEKQAAAAETIVARDVLPALGAQVLELRRHREAANSNAGVWDLPDGEAYYRWALKAGTTTELSPQEVHDLGKEKLAEVQSRMEQILRAEGMTQGTVGERMLALGERPDQIYPNTDAGREELLTYVRALVDDIRGRMPEAFDTLVPGSLNVVRVPPEIELGAPGGSAAPGSVDGTQPGRYNINLRDTALQPKFGLPTLTYHEAIPGHVWQGEYTFKQPLMRTLLAFNAYSEGWALYSEQLADELGVYDDNPLGELGYLQANAFRCCRLVVDTGMHALRWTREQAIQWFMENNGSPRGEVESEIDRYCAWPGQACGYKVGEIAINRARDRAKARLGSDYDLREFNDAVVLGGGVPMTVLDTVIDRYIARELRA